MDTLHVMQITKSMQWYSLSYSLLNHWQSRWTIPLSGASIWCMGVCVHVCAKSLQLCLTLGNPIDCNLPGFSVHGILQARMLEGVVMPSSRGSSHAFLQEIRPRDWTNISEVSCTGKQCSLPLVPPGKPWDLPNLGIKPVSPVLVGRFSTRPSNCVQNIHTDPMSLEWGQWT